MGLRKCGERFVTTPKEVKRATTANTVAREEKMEKETDRREILYRGDVPVLFVKVWLERIGWSAFIGRRRPDKFDSESVK